MMQTSTFAFMHAVVLIFASHRNPHITLMKASLLIGLYLNIAIAFISCLEENMLALAWHLLQEVIGK